jgi:hypothetical protein
MKQSAYYPLCASEDLQIEETATEVIVFDNKNQRFHFLNATAYSIFKACNGSNNIRDIALLLAREFESEDVDSLVNDVAETVSGFQDKGLLMFVAYDPQLQQIPDSMTESPLLAVSVTGTSMFPVLLSGDKVLVKKSSLEELSAGDIIVWSDESLKRVAHRILSMEGSANPPLITTKGDMRLGPDAPVEFDRVIGKIVAVLRDGEVRWMTELDENNKRHSSKAAGNGKRERPAVETAQPERRPSYKKMKVLDLREISVESIRNIESVEEISLVLLSPKNAHAWSEVPAQDVKTVFTAPPDYRVYTGQPELLPDMLEFLDAPLRLIVSGQLFLTAFEPEQISQAFKELILIGQAYVSSVESKAALESLTNIVSGAISVVPREHARWIGQSILGPEYLSNALQPPLVAIGYLAVSERMGEIPESISLFR